MLDSTPATPATSLPLRTKRERTRNRLLGATQELLKTRSAGSLSIRDISQQAQVSHPTFYNYFESVEDLLENFALLFLFTHAQYVGATVAGRVDIGEVFSVSTRQTLRLVADTPLYGHYLFDCGIRIDHFVTGIREQLRLDLSQGVASGRFVIPQMNLTVAEISGCLLGVALGLHRGDLDHDAIEPATEHLLCAIGVGAREAAALARVEMASVPTPPLPLQWPIAEHGEQA